MKLRAYNTKTKKLVNDIHLRLDGSGDLVHCFDDYPNEKLHGNESKNIVLFWEDSYKYIHRND